MGHTQLYNLVSGDGGYLFALEIDEAGFGLENTADGLQGRCFTGAVGPDEGDDFSFFHMEGQALQCVDHAIIYIQIFYGKH